MLHAGIADLESLLVEEGSVTPADLERARRIAGRMQNARRPAELLVETGRLARAEFERVVRLHRSRLGLIDLLREDSVLTDEQASDCLRARFDRPELSDRDLLVGSGLVSEEQYLLALSAKHDIPMVVPDIGLVDPALLAKASFPYLLRNQVLPLREADGQMVAIFADPLDLEVRAEIERIFQREVRPCCATGPRILEALRTLERLKEGKSKQPDSSLQYREIGEVAPRDASGEGAVAIVDYLMIRAVQLRASDLHIEPLEKKVRVRVRLDGVLQPLTDLPSGFAPQVISRVKVLAGADIAERRLHQDGRISVRVEGREVDIRVSSYVSVYGETLVLRLLDRQRGLVPLQELGFGARVLPVLRDEVLRTSSGLVLVTGPTGSGKTTTLYSCVDYVHRPDIKVISCEDPVEYVMDGVIQCSVNSDTGPTFADSLRAIVRQDPDVIVVGEIRDDETAALAVQCALTGHKVLSTFHTEDAVGALIRLKEMRLPPYLIASTVTGIVAQRLLRRVCPECAAPAEAGRDDLRFLGLTRQDVAGMALVAGRGCEACGHTGFRGRIGVHELLQPDDDLRDAILGQAPSKDLRRLARRRPAFTTLQEAGVLKAAEGLTTLAEVVANAPRDPEPRAYRAIREIAGGEDS